MLVELVRTESTSDIYLEQLKNFPGKARHHINFLFYAVGQRCTSHVQLTVCNDVCCCAVHRMERPGPAWHVAGEGRTPSAIGGEGERTLSERDR
jgi:hypothetical protein